jgi:hypothetical protein
MEAFGGGAALGLAAQASFSVLPGSEIYGFKYANLIWDRFVQFSNHF